MAKSELKSRVDSIQKEALEVLRKHFGERVTIEGGGYGPTHASFKFKFQIASDEDVVSKLRTDFAAYCPLWGLVPSDIDLALTMNGGEGLTMTGINLGSSSWPFSGTTSSGKRVKFTEQTFLAARARSAQKKNAA